MGPNRMSSPADAARQDRRQLQGVWRLVHAESDGVAEPRSKLRGFRMVFRGPVVVERVKGHRRPAVYTLDAAAEPRAIDLFSPEFGERSGIYGLCDGRLTLCLADVGGARPQDFATAPASGRSLLVLERVTAA